MTHLDPADIKRGNDIAARLDRGFSNGAASELQRLFPDMRANDFAAMAEMFPRLWAQLNEPPHPNP